MASMRISIRSMRIEQNTNIGKMEQYGALKIAWRAVKIPFFKKGYFFLKTNVQIYVLFKCNRKLRIAWFKVISI